eukprot:1093795-Rhodomonas_salina.3
MSNPVLPNLLEEPFGCISSQPHIAAQAHHRRCRFQARGGQKGNFSLVVSMGTSTVVSSRACRIVLNMASSTGAKIKPTKLVQKRASTAASTGVSSTTQPKALLKISPPEVASCTKDKVALGTGVEAGGYLLVVAGS